MNYYKHNLTRLKLTLHLTLHSPYTKIYDVQGNVHDL